MKKILISGAILLTVAAVALFIFHPYFNTTTEQDYPYDGNEPDLPNFAKHKVNKEEFMLRRAEGRGLKRGLDKNKPLPDRKARQRAIARMERQEDALANMPESAQKESLTAAWTPIGPAPIPNGQVHGPNPIPVSGRVTAIAVHPTNPNIVYVGAAQGGLYRTTDGGVNWTPMLDNSTSLAIGAVTIDTGQPETVYVGTGEGNFGIDSFFGVGVYRIDNASGASPTVTGPLNKDAAGNDVFSGRAITKIAVYEFLPGQIYVATARGIGGIGNFNTQGNPLPNRGIYRSDNITSPNPTFRQVGVYPNSGPVVVDMDVRDIVLDPTNADLMIASVNSGGGRGGLYWSNLHRSLLLNIPWIQSLQFNGANDSQNNAELAIHHTAAAQPPTVYAATGVNGGTVFRSTNHDMFNPNAPPPSWTQIINNNFCSPQCFYDIAVAVDPVNASRVYLGGAPTSANFPGALTFGISTNSAD